MTRIFINTRFEGFHSWPDAPNEVKFLALPHRHEFHVKVWKRVNHDDRETEFILYKREVGRIICKLMQEHDVKTWSCETWARMIGHEAGADQVEVSEDGESGSEWNRSP